MTTARRPGLLDQLDLALLRLAKRRRERFSTEEAFYDTFFTDADVEKYRSDVRNLWRFRTVADIQARLFGDRQATVVDVGCGLAAVAVHLPAATAYRGVEFSPATLALAARLHAGRPGVRLERGGFPDLPVGDGEADLALCFEVVEHVRDDRAAVRELARIVRPGGYLLFSVPGTHYWPEYESLIGHFRHYTGDAARDLLRDAGFDVVRSVPQHRGFWRFYHYGYVAALAVATLLSRLTGRPVSLFSSGVYRALSRRILAVLADDGVRDDPGSTFLLARRRVP